MVLLKDLKGVLIRNMSTANMLLKESDTCQIACFFSMHLVDGKTGAVVKESFYSSTLCRKTSNPSWTDVDHTEMLMHINMGAIERGTAEKNKFVIRVWNCLCRPYAGRGCSSDVPHDMQQPLPRPAPWSCHRWKLDEDLCGRRCNDGGHGGCPAASAACKLPDRSSIVHGEIVETKLLFENVLDLRMWVKVESSLSEVKLSLPRNAIFFSISDSVGVWSTYVDASISSMSGLLQKMNLNRDLSMQASRADGFNQKHRKRAAASGNILGDTIKNANPTVHDSSNGTVTLHLSNGERRSEDASGQSTPEVSSASRLQEVVREEGGVEEQKHLPRVCSARSQALAYMRKCVMLKKVQTALAKQRLEELLSSQAAKEQELLRKRESAGRLRDLRRRVAEEENKVQQLSAQVEREEGRVQVSLESERLRKSLGQRVLTVMNLQMERDSPADESARRRSSDTAEEDSMVPANSLDEARRKRSQAIDADRQALRDARKELRTRQNFLTAALHSAYPIFTAADGVTRTICGLMLPALTSSSSGDDEMVSTALGHVCHVVLLMSKYVGLTLRFLPVPMSSRSVMRDLSVSSSRNNTKDGNDFPLFLKGQDRTRVQVAVLMLSKDVDQLLAAHGVMPVDVSLLQATPNGSQLSILANLQNIIIACRQRFLTAQGGLEALSSLDSSAMSVLAISEEDANHLAMLSTVGGGSGKSSRASSEHGGATSERKAMDRSSSSSSRLPGQDYLSGLAKGVDRLLESVMFPTVTSSNAQGGADEGDGASSASTVRSDQKRSRRKERERREREREREREKGRGEGVDYRDSPEIKHHHRATRAWEEELDAKWGSNARSHSRREADSEGERAGRMAEMKHLRAGDVEQEKDESLTNFFVSKDGSQAFYEMYKAATDGMKIGSEDEASLTGKWIGAMRETSNRISSMAEQGMGPVDRTLQYILYPTDLKLQPTSPGSQLDPSTFDEDRGAGARAAAGAGPAEEDSKETLGGEPPAAHGGVKGGDHGGPAGSSDGGERGRGVEEGERIHDLSSETERAAFQEMLWGVRTGEDAAMDDEEAWTAGLDRLAQDASFT